MSSFDADRGVIILDVEQWDVLERMIVGPIADRASYEDGAAAGLADLGLIDRVGLTAAAQPVLSGRQLAEASYTIRSIAPRDSVPMREMTIWLAKGRCTVERIDLDGVHIYACDEVEVPHIALANDHLMPRPVIDDGPRTVLDTLAGAVRDGDTQATYTIMRTIASMGPRDAAFVREVLDDRWGLVLRIRAEAGLGGFELVSDEMTLGTPSMLYQLEEREGPSVDPRGPASEIPLVSVLATDVWARWSSQLWPMD